MSETIAGRRVFSLYEVGASIKRTLQERYSSTFWVKAELHKLNHYSHSGHCYPELVEKTEGKIIAQFRSVLWKTDFERINVAFLKTIKEPLQDGITILFEASVQYDPLYDLSLRIHDIDPSYSLGELERERQANIERLKREGIFHQNKTLTFPKLPQRLAIISVETSKGYADFLKMIDQNSWGYRYFHYLFPALLQGEKAVASIISALSQIRKVKQHFDLVLIIRGGGGDIGLSCYNHYDLAREIALFPIPVLSGVGHATNETIAEMVSYRHFITPTESAGFLIQAFHNLSVPVERAKENLLNVPERIIKRQQEHLYSLAKYFTLSARKSIREEVLFSQQAPERLLAAVQNTRRFQLQQLQNQEQRIKSGLFSLFSTQNYRIEALENQTRMLDPALILKRGFSITTLNGKVLQDADQAKADAVIETILYKGKIRSYVLKTNNIETNE